MVFFTCNACGESLKKAQVDKHVGMCCGCQVLSCIDCGKDFWGDDYKDHNRCISEDQKYGGKDYEAKANKGDVKQQQWIQKVNAAMNKPGVSAKLKDVLAQVRMYDNVPRKKAKFQNWMRNSLRISNTSLHEDVWSIITAADASPAAPEVDQQPKATVLTNGTKELNGHTDTVEETKLDKRQRKEARRQKKNGKATKNAENTPEEEEKTEKTKTKKRKRRRNGEDGDEEQETDQIEDEVSRKKTKKTAEAADLTTTEETDDQTAKGKFNWKGTIKAVLRDSPENELCVKKLRKKVLSAYYSFTGDGNFKTQEEILALFNKKINNNPKFRLLKDRVKLVK